MISTEQKATIEQSRGLIPTLQACQAALDMWGIDKQKEMLVEEMGELLTVMNHERRGRVCKVDVMDEIADVYIMIIQMILAYGLDECNAVIGIRVQKLAMKLGIVPNPNIIPTP